MANTNRRSRNYQVEYAKRNARARRDGFSSYGAQRRDFSRAWSHYEPNTPIAGNRKQYNEFKRIRDRIARIRKSDAIPEDRKQPAINYIMHRYMRDYHSSMMEPGRERIVWSFEGETP